jgi:hypothetical protein
MMSLLKQAASPATFIAVLALVAAVVGTAIAGPKNSNPAKTAQKALELAEKSQKLGKANQKRINAIQLTPGPRGPQGLPGADGARGEPGPHGSDAASATFARVNELTSDATGYGPVTGIISEPGGSPGVGWLISPNATMVARDLFVEFSIPPGEGKSREITLLEGNTPTALKCTISGNNNTCNSGSSTATIDPGSLLVFRFVGTGGAAATEAWVGWRATTP